MTNREDWGISELSQAGISSRAYRPGPYSRCEGLPRAFDQMILERERQAVQRSPRSPKPGTPKFEPSNAVE
jgi:hypothetical protein